MMRCLFDRWERVWHEGQYDLVGQCVQPNYIRHDEPVQERPDIRAGVCDLSSMVTACGPLGYKWTDPKTGEARCPVWNAVLPYRGRLKLAETWRELQSQGSA